MPASGEFVDRLAEHLVSGGVGVLATGLPNPTSVDTMVQVNYRRDTPAQIVLLQQQGGLPFERAKKEQYAIQVLVDGATLSGTKAKAREIYDLLHETTATVIGGHKVLWLRATTLPQAIPTGPGKERFQVSVNFDALLVRDE